MRRSWGLKEGEWGKIEGEGVKIKRFEFENVFSDQLWAVSENGGLVEIPAREELPGWDYGHFSMQT